MGKSASKLKKKKRSQSIAWSFRFPSLASLGSLSRPRARMAPPAPAPPPPAARPHLDVRQWLAVLDLAQYGAAFQHYGGVEELLGLSEEDVRALGVRNSAHRARLVSSLVALRCKYDKGGGGRRGRDAPQRHSVAVDGSRLARPAGSSDILVAADAAQSKSLCDLAMDASPEAAAGADAAALRRALEWELSLDSRDLRSHAWYHGAVPRQRAEDAVQADGDFLVRDCASQPGNFVLTCRWRGLALHFVINKVVIQPDTVYERVQFQFEDDCYDTVPDLITFYVGSGKSISSLSGARIQAPRNRLFPLSFYATKYGAAAAAGGAVSPLASPLGGAGGGGGAGTLRYNPYNAYRSPVHSPPRAKRDTPPRLPSKKQRSHSLTPSELNGRGGAGGAGGGGGACPPAHGPRGAAPAPPDERSSSADGVIQTGAGAGKFSTHSLPRSAALCPAKGAPPAKSMVRVTSDPALSPCLERRRFGFLCSDPDEPDLPEQPPPKPSRVPSLPPAPRDAKEAAGAMAGAGAGATGEGGEAEGGAGAAGAPSFQRVASYHASGSDSGNGSGDSAQSSAAGDAGEGGAGGGGGGAAAPAHRGVVIKNPRYLCGGGGHARRASAGGGGGGAGAGGAGRALAPALEYDSAAEDSLVQLAPPDAHPPSAFDLEAFATLLLPALENKPLDASALHSVRLMLQETGPRVLANHLTRVDLELTAGGGMQAPADGGGGGSGGGGWEAELGLGVTCGLELCSLPHGRQLRLDLIERTECLKLLVAVTILTCASEAERAEVLNKWIQVAIDTKTALGNLYGFCGIMMGLCMPQVQRLTSTWHVLRQKFTDSAFNFEAKLRPTLKSMNECSNPQAPNTTIPHLLPFILLLERSLDDILGMVPSSNMALSVLGSWESSTADFGLSTLYAHLEAARKFGESLPTFRRNAEIVLGDTKVDDLLLDAFRTEFHLKFLWGSRGAAVAPTDRHAKFHQVLCVMSEKCEPPSPVHSPVGTAV